MNMGGPHRYSDEPQRSNCKSMIRFYKVQIRQNCLMALRVREVFILGAVGRKQKGAFRGAGKFCISSSHDLEICTPYCMDVTLQ